MALVSRISLLLLVFLPLSTFAQLTGKVISVSDGDTFTMLTSDHKQVKVRLHGIDCPEKKQAYGERAKQFTGTLVFGQVVHADIKDTDRYGRSIAIVTVKGKVVNEHLLLNGFAWHYVKYDKTRRYDSLENVAKTNRAGLWQDDAAVAPWDYRKLKN